MTREEYRDRRQAEVPKLETPHPELTFSPPTFEPWVLCPECRSRHGTQIRMRELDEGDTAWFESSTVVWLECLSCGHESNPEPGAFVQQPDDAEDYSLREKFMEFIDDHF